MMRFNPIQVVTPEEEENFSDRKPKPHTSFSLRSFPKFSWLPKPRPSSHTKLEPNDQSPWSSKLPPELFILVLDHLASSSLANLRKAITLNRALWHRYHSNLFQSIKLNERTAEGFYESARLLNIPLIKESRSTSNSGITQEGDHLDRRQIRFMAICRSIVYLRLEDQVGGQALVNTIHHARSIAKSLFVKVKYLILGHKFVSDSIKLRVPSKPIRIQIQERNNTTTSLQTQDDPQGDDGLKAMLYISHVLNPKHVCLNIHRHGHRRQTARSPYPFNLLHLVPLFEHFDEVESLTQHLDSGREARFVMWNVKLTRFFLPTYPENLLYSTTGMDDNSSNNDSPDDDNSQSSDETWQDVEVMYKRPRIRDIVNGYSVDVNVPCNSTIMPAKGSQGCVCCDKK
ncbi:hypothetical protein I302_106504 [Kwoniella bestiolae CBS 10118]|uniref:F-box domain-containing protein n=1 Tax=Kwoniella bestiolae CBS 10118 TaxID=1296100 RepID=A0A1B9G181_9TREE|nr:hypothetical protein I302_06238 [Kwoniella bestiolae CBS 10118]OCF24777.1 hypothetical protein I302_06238 [Kwoniella bestiolae CBS 10118]